MWTNVSLNCHPIWDEVQWSVTAIWRDTIDAEPVMLTRTGRASMGDHDSPERILTAALDAFVREARLERGTPRST